APPADADRKPHDPYLPAEHSLLPGDNGWPNVGGRALGEGSALSVSVREPLQRRPPAGIVRLRRPGSGRGGVRLLRGARLARTSWQSPHSSGSGPAAERLSPLAV